MMMRRTNSAFVMIALLAVSLSSTRFAHIANANANEPEAASEGMLRRQGELTFQRTLTVSYRLCTTDAVAESALVFIWPITVTLKVDLRTTSIRTDESGWAITPGTLSISKIEPPAGLADTMAAPVETGLTAEKDAARKHFDTRSMELATFFSKAYFLMETREISDSVSEELSQLVRAVSTMNPPNARIAQVVADFKAPTIPNLSLCPGSAALVNGRAIVWSDGTKLALADTNVAFGAVTRSISDATNVIRGTEGSIGTVYLAHTALRQTTKADLPGFERKMVGGKSIHDPRKYPWTVAFTRRLLTGGYSPFCGGSLIAPRIVLTARHCDPGPQHWAVIGEPDLSKVPNANAEVLQVDHAEPVPGYNANLQYDDDIELVYLKSPSAQKRKTVVDDQVRPTSTYYVLGWGATETGNVSSILMEGQVQGALLDLCKSEYSERAKKDPGNWTVTDNMNCLTGDKTGTCVGDSGGPLFFGEGNIVGIVSFGAPCVVGRSQPPGLFTKFTPRYLDWIRKAIGPTP